MSRVSRLQSDLRLVRNSAEALQRVFGERPTAAAAIDTAPHPFDFDPLTLTTMQQAAMMQQHESYFSRMIVRAILEDSQDKPTLSDHHALVELGLSKKGLADKWHSLTMPGVIAAKKLEPALAKQFDVHAMAGPLGEGHSVRFYCPCGWHTSVRNSHTARGNASVSWRNHHSTQEGMSKLVAALKPPGMVGT